jgi:RNA polymerase sigma-70 factor (ECF subfamily)
MIADQEMAAGLRPRMMSVAYRMLGSVADAEDVVQDAFVRLQTADEVTSPEGFLVRTTTRLCIDRLRAAKRRRGYVGPWVPEPVDTAGSAPEPALSESLTQAFLLLLERLSPGERAAFLLRTVFDYEYAEIAAIVGRSEVHARQLVSRAKRRLGRAEPRYQPSRREADGLAERFVSACRAGDVRAIEQMMTEDVAAHTDGGGKAAAARVVIRGRPRTARFLAGVFRKRLRECEVHAATVNGVPGVVFMSAGRLIHVMSFDVGDAVRAVYSTLNPDKLARWSVADIK